MNEAPFALDGKGTDVDDYPRGIIPLPKRNHYCLKVFHSIFTFLAR